MNKLLALLGFDPAKHSVKVEMIAGLTTFLTMSYILAVNPLILGETGMDRGALFSATAVAALIATLVMAFYAKMPFALASGMGLNAFFAYTLVLSMGYTWEEALAAVFFEGVVFILLTVFKVREAIVNAIPVNLRYSISVGIGLFIAYIGLKNGGDHHWQRCHCYRFGSLDCHFAVGRWWRIAWWRAHGSWYPWRPILYYCHHDCHWHTLWCYSIAE